MSNLTLGCGPYFDEGGIIVSLILFLAVKPLAYFAFIQAFRYRVSRPIPMRFRQAAWLTAMRTGMGIGIIGVGAGILWMSQSPTMWMASWGYLYAERVFSWWFVGWRGAGLRGRRLAGWIISGTLINAAFDFAMVAGALDGWLWPTVVVAVIAVFIGGLHLVGRRESLRQRFAAFPTCAGCGYDLTGNLSGRCPECGRAISANETGEVGAALST